MKTTVKSTNPSPKLNPLPSHQPSTVRRQDRRTAIILFALCLGLYSRTLAPGLLFGDSGEFQMAAWRFGLAHPTGYPLYLLLGGMWQHLAALLGVDPAASLNWFSALLAAGAVAVFYLAVLAWMPKRVTARVAAFVVALLIAVNPTLWSQAVVAEVYALHALFIALFLLLTAPNPPISNPPISNPPINYPPRHLLILSSLLGLSLTHHRTTLFLLPGLFLWLFWRDRSWWQRGKTWIALVGGLALPQLLYVYIPLRSGFDASPWLYPRLGGEILTLYTPTFQGFVDFITGSVFAVSFFSPAQALARMPEAANLWLLHFTWSGIALVLLGLVVLIRGRRWPLLLLTLPAALLLQIFNLFYGIGDIYVYYIPLYLVAALWAGCGVDWLIGVSGRRPTTDDPRNSQLAKPIPQLALWFVLFLILPASLFVTHFPAMDQSANNAARAMWQTILDSQPPDNAILISNDRNEIVPLYYLQAVEGKAPELTGLFPLLTPEERFTDVAAVTTTALAAGDRPVYLIKPMAGLESKFDVEAATPPLVRVVGPVGINEINQPTDIGYGPLTLLGYMADETDGGLALTLYWRVDEQLTGNYTTSVQLFDSAGNKVAQDDRPPGGQFYPTSLWKPGDIVRDAHLLPSGSLPAAAHMQILLYTQPDLNQLAPALEIRLP